ncbi:MAG: hypothetical protein B6241_15525 [Spirochaetaceae bacterium 4572_59]|nr:MAG: hypothetical protein B6241_15525 [Spirochaetaceae bacterium 4572_59]
MDNEKIKEKMDSLQEVKDMFSTSVEKYGKKLIEQGIEQGIEKGIEQGEYKKALADAENMKKYGIKADIICKVTGLSYEVVEDL